MAGVERNPGLAGKFIFRYQYLLVKLGTDVLMKVFDKMVGYNLVQYLTSKSQVFQRLINARVITADQRLLLPPINNQPDSSKFDMTLLSCLLRNICGLRQPWDPVWRNPMPTDFSVEADITRLRMCRNQLMHSDRLVLPEAELNSKWQDLSSILLRLNNVGGIADLQSDIHNAAIMKIDEQFRKQLDKTLQEWQTGDRLLGQRIDEILSEVSKVKQLLDHVVQDIHGVKRKLEDVECKKNVDHTDIQKYLVDLYMRRCKTLPVSPLFQNKDENLLSIYKYPNMYSVKCNIEETTEKKEIKCYEDVFHKDGHVFKDIYIVGDAGVGKTSFCTCMSFLWCYAKSEHELEDKYKKLQEVVEYMSKFEFVFFVSLRDSCYTRVVDMIIEQLFDDNKEKYQIIDTILRHEQTLILMDGLDEWVPSQVAGKKMYKLPARIYSKNCVYLTTTRPYRIESVRLSRKDVDHQVEIKGISGESAMSYIEDVIQYMNKENSDNRKLEEFLSDMKKCKLEEELCIPTIASHLVILWFEQTLTDLPRALVYSNILEMLFKRAEKRGVDISSSTESKFQHLPKSLSGFKYLNKHVSLLYNVCNLSFRSLFKQDKNASNLVFTVDQLVDEPYCFTDAETDLLCKIGILSKNEVSGCYSVEKLKISFIHKSYIEFFAALFIVSSDISQSFDTQWNLSLVLQFQHTILLVVGFFAEGGKVLFDNLYQLMSDDLSICRRNAIFNYNDKYSYQRQLESLQNVVIRCFKEVSRSNDPNIVLKLEDFIFDDNSFVDILRQLLLLNTTCVKSIYSVVGKYYEEFDQINTLQCLHVGKMLSGFDVKFIKCMLQNQSTLHTVCIKGGDILPQTLIPELDVKRLKHLTSLSLSDVKIKHDSLCTLVTFLSDNISIENIKLSSVYCDNHEELGHSDCALFLSLPHHTKLTSLCLWDVNLLCHSVNKSCLKYIRLSPISKRVVRWYIGVFICIKYSELEHLDINGSDMLDCGTMKTLTQTVKTMQHIKSLTLGYMKLPADALLQLNADVTQVEIVLSYVTMSRQCFQCFIESCVQEKSLNEVLLKGCIITSVDEESDNKDSVYYMSKYLASISTVNITSKLDYSIRFETGSCQ